MFTVEKDDEYLQELQVLGETYDRIGELDAAIVWALEREAKSIPGSLCITGEWYIWTTTEFYENILPGLRIIYEIRDENIVHLQSIDEIKEE